MHVMSRGFYKREHFIFNAILSSKVILNHIYNLHFSVVWLLFCNYCYHQKGRDILVFMSKCNTIALEVMLNLQIYLNT